MVKNYIKSKISLLIIILSISVIFSIVFYVENIQISTVLYSFLLCLVALLVFLVIDFIRFKNKINSLLEIKKDIFNKIDLLPIPATYDEQIYKEIISDLTSLQLETQTIYNKKSTDISDFYTKWVHQIKTPIFALNLLIDEIPNNSNYLSELSKIEQYTTMVLAYIRLEESTSDFVFKRYNINDIIKNCVKNFKSVFISKKIKLIIDIEDFSIKTDKKHLEFAINQVLSNAIKYTNRGEINIIARDNCVIISDTGIGIEQSNMARIFDKGFTGISGRVEEKSTGLGLYLCKKSLDLLGFSINVTSKINIGTTVSINLTQTQTTLK